MPATVGEITIEFDRDVVRFGQSDHTEVTNSIETAPELECSWYWISPRTLTCYLNENLQESSLYSVQVHPNFTALDGSSLGQSYLFTIRTTLPSVRLRKVNWRTSGEPIISVGFTQPVTYASFAETIQFRNTDTNAVLSGNDLIIRLRNVRSVLIQKFDREWETIEAFQDRTKSRRVPDIEKVASKDWYVSSTQKLDQNSLYFLELKPGLSSILGDQPTTASMDIREIKAFPDFQLVGIECTDKKTKSEQLHSATIPPSLKLRRAIPMRIFSCCSRYQSIRKPT